MPTLRVIDPRRARRNRWLLIGLWSASVLLAYIVGRYVMIPDAGGLSEQLAASRASEASARTELEETQQRLAVVERSEQIARLANENVQAALSEKDGEIAELKHDLAIYDRLIGADSARQGLSVYDVKLRPGAQGAVAFRVVVSQTKEVRGETEGRMSLSVEGDRAGQAERLDWADLAGDDLDKNGIAYDFRYFQRLEGRFILPAGFTPRSLRVTLKGRGDETVEHDLPWAQAINQGND